MPEITIDQVHNIVGELYVRNKMLEELLADATRRIQEYVDAKEADLDQGQDDPA